ncbi:MAG: hypothetical protein A2X13_02135 [Bacteroidetes bacterium GWC2_33_15]|nr:MAG: hypothetical protein A2X10_07490 [Bacteroidetes bacterium GWA2_33_15]OFX52275.1 MAG: hypothetical protein A2X13_02135 [Bacteroidetes bacterium GWC2_33_15]OFX64429.1 MAG: hypothetical protein A2X15_12955 [Bacteroidetes bacterium GWB2_32_14]OFX67834.1 MAG: hypothetical protein A2X14_06780 [Bacteroidetes bacterium GWD2_33_33]HAN19451.1 hypothetical protein [Bacteroidales bacterium]
MNFLKTIVGISLFGISNAFGAVDVPDEPVDTIAIDEIEITANRLVNFTNGAKIQKIYQSEIIPYNSSNLSELFSQVTTVSVKSYGISGLSNISLRGMTSKHTAVLWNGFNLQNSMNGGHDMNCIPSFLIDEIDIQYGGSGALFGSGAVGGVIHLISSLKLNEGIDIRYNQSYGSFSNFFEGLKFNISNDKTASSTRIYHKSGENDFEFVNTQEFGKPKVKQQNSSALQYGILQSNLFRINENQKIITNIWAQSLYREVPAMMTNTNSLANEYSELFRFSTLWNRNTEFNSWFARVYLNYESLIYKDPLIGLISEMDNSSFVSEIENKFTISNNFIFNTGLNYNFEQVETQNYSKTNSRNRTALFTSIKYINNSNTFTSVLSFREELVNKAFTPLTLSLNSKYFITKYVNINSTVSKTYNYPAFNDLYWNPGGNPGLKNENGWSEDLGFGILLKNNSRQLLLGITVFNSNLENMVVWLPTTSTYWTAENVEKLWSRGIESQINYNYKLNKLYIGIDLKYSYIKSTYEESENTESVSVGKQLLYIPYHKGNGILSLTYKWINLKYYQNYTGERFITKDNSQSIAPFWIADLSLGSNVKLKNSEIHLNFKINNIWNATYQVMAFYAMPLRYYSISLSYNFNKPFN